MKKFNILIFIFALALILTGCATVSDVVDTNGKSFYCEEIVYNQGQVVEVGDYIYYGNGYTSISNSDFNYDKAAKFGYLARINTAKELTFDSKIEAEYIKNSSPKGIEKVNKKLAGYDNQNMFALGSYIYFTSANTHKNSSLENDYKQVSLFRVKFNGDDFKEIETFKHDENSIITVQKGSDNNYYYVITEPDKTSNGTYNLFSIKIGNSIGEIKQLNKYTKDGKEVVDPIESVVVCDNDSTIKNVLYTTKSTETEIETDCVKKVDFATEEIETIDGGVISSVTKLLGRTGDKVFYAYTQNKITEIYYKNLTTDDGNFNPTESRKFYSAAEINNIVETNEKYVFISQKSNSLMLKNELQGDAELLLTSSEYDDVLFADGDYVYYSNDTMIGRINIETKEKQTLVTLNSIISGQCGYTGEYIYFYAKIQDREEDFNDENYYMFRTDKEGNYQLIGKTI